MTPVTTIIPTGPERCRVRQRLTFQTPGPDLDVVLCTCGRMFDEARFAVHMGGRPSEKEGA